MGDQYNLRRNVSTALIAFSANIIVVIVSYRLVVLEGGVALLGLWSALTAWLFLVRLGDVGMASAVVRYAAACDHVNEPLRVRRYVDTGLAVNAALFSVLSVGGWVLIHTHLTRILPHDPHAIAMARSILPIMFAAVYFQNLSGLTLGALSAIHLGFLAAWVHVIGTTIQLAMVFVLVPRTGLAGLASAQLLQHLFVLVTGWVLFISRLANASGVTGGVTPRHASLSVAREVLGFSFRAQFSNVANGVFEPISKIAISRVAGLELLGVYELAYKLVALPRNAVVSGVQATIPAMTRLFATDVQAARALYRKSTLRTGVSVSAVLIAITLVSPALTPMWLGSSEPLLPVFTALLAIGFIANTWGAPAHTLGMACGRVRGNIEAALLADFLVVTLTVAGAVFYSPVIMVGGVTVALSAGGFWVRKRNERLLDNGPQYTDTTTARVVSSAFVSQHDPR
jgi:O-antigen/teichoic acid export membrane protein